MTPYARRRTPASSLAAAALAAAVAVASFGPPAASAASTAPAASTTPPASAPTDCASTVPTADLAELTDPAGIETFDEARSRVTQLRGVLTRNADYRGTFALAFDEILALTEPTLTSGIYDDPVWAEALALEVARLYLANLHHYVTGAAPAAHWAAAFAETGRCERSPGRVLLGAIVAHLVIDMPEALVTIGSTPGHTRDFYTFGEALVAAAPVIADEFESTYGTDLRPFFTGWIAGDLLGETATTTFMFQSGRTVAWINHFGLANPATRDLTRLEMTVVLDAANGVLDGLEAVGTI